MEIRQTRTMNTFKIRAKLFFKICSKNESRFFLIIKIIKLRKINIKTIQ